jgi:CMP-N-acetylneuraminic acid synthetase
MLPNVTAMIPARIGSERLPRKNLSLIGGKTPIEWAIEAAKRAEVFSDIYLNSESEKVEIFAQRNGVKFHLRNPIQAASAATGDEVVDEFLQHHRPEYLAWVSPTSPLQPSSDIKAAVEAFFEKQADSLITVYTEQVHVLFEGRPLNFTREGPWLQTQKLDTFQRFVYSVMMWKCESFRRSFANNGYGMVNGRFIGFPVSKLSSLFLKTAEDYHILNAIAVGRPNASSNVCYLD